MGILNAAISFEEFVDRFGFIATGKLPYVGFKGLVECYMNHIQAAENIFQQNKRIYKFVINYDRSYII